MFGSHEIRSFGRADGIQIAPSFTQITWMITNIGTAIRNHTMAFLSRSSANSRFASVSVP